MSALGEKTFMLLLTDTESLEVVFKDGMPTVVIPTPAYRPVVDFARAFYNTNDKAPSIAILKDRFPDVWSDNNLDLDEDVEETIEWAIEDLKQSYAQLEVGKFTRRLATEIAQVEPERRLERLGELSSELSGLVFSLQPRTTAVDLRESGPALLAEYEMAATSDGVRGMRLGLPEVDNHLGGIWDGELCVIGGIPGSGKSFFADYIALQEWKRGRCTTLFTLENSILMTQMRLACMALHINIEDLQTGNLSDDDLRDLQEWCNDTLLASDTPLHILNPDMVNRNPHAIVQAAKAYGTESLVVDQLSHIEAVQDTRQQDRRNEVSKIVRVLGDLISTGRHEMPCVLMHQVNREGIKVAAQTGRVSMVHMAEAAEVERTASLVLCLYASAEDQNMQPPDMQLQMLKQRRVKPMDWRLRWMPHLGAITVRPQIDMGGIEPQEGQVLYANR